MTQGKLPNRIPFEDVSQVKSWLLPSVGGKVVPSVQRQEQKKSLPKQPNETVETLAQDSVSPQPMKASELREMVETATREGFNEGYNEGIGKGIAEGERQGRELGKLEAYAAHSQILQQQAQGLASICQDLMEPLASQNSELENLVVNLAVQLAKHLLQQELQQRPEAIFPVVQAAFASLPGGAQHLKLYLHPEDLAFVSVHAQAMGKDWQCIGDGTISRGSCRLETPQTLVNYRIEDRLAEWLAQSQLRAESAEDLIVMDLRPVAPPVSPPAEVSAAPAGQAEASLQAIHPAADEQRHASVDSMDQLAAAALGEPSNEEAPAASANLGPTAVAHGS